MTNNIQDELSILDRLTAPTPTFFAKIRNVCLTLAAIGLGVAQIQAELPFELPTYISIIANKLVILGNAVAGLISTMTVDIEAYKKKMML